MSTFEINERNASSRWTPLHLAAFRGQVAEIVRLVAEGADVNARDTEGWTPLLCAIFGDMQIFHLRFGSKKDRRIYGEHHAQYVQVVECVIEHGADVNATVLGGVTLLGAAKLLGSAEFAGRLQRFGAK